MANDWTVTGVRVVMSDVDSGSDPEMDGESMEEDSGGTSNHVWKTVEIRKKKRNRQLMSETDSDKGSHLARRRKKEFKVMMKFISESGNNINPLRLTKALKESIGNLEDVKKLKDNRLLLFCKDSKQQKTILGLKSMIGIKVECSIPEEKKWIRGVMTGIPIDVSVEEIKRNITGATVKEVKRLKCFRNGEKSDSLSVMMVFDEIKMPERVYLGFLSYVVRTYIPPPLRCFKCQKYGHVAAVCHGKQRCARCGGEHKYGECGQGTKLKCCNCGGQHSAAYGGCTVRKVAVKVQNVRMEEGMSYAEALKKVKQTPKIDKIKAAPVVTQAHYSKVVAPSRNIEVIADKVSFITFMAEVVNCSAQTESRTERIKIIIKAAEKYLEIRDISVEMINERLIIQTANSQVVTSQASCGGS